LALEIISTKIVVMDYHKMAQDGINGFFFFNITDTDSTGGKSHCVVDDT